PSLPHLHAFPTRRSSDLFHARLECFPGKVARASTTRLSRTLPSQSSPFASGSIRSPPTPKPKSQKFGGRSATFSISDFLSRFSRSEEHTSELQSLRHLVC